jgi:glutamate dehydrogenase
METPPMNATTDSLRRERLAAVLAAAAERLPAERMAMFDSYARECLRQLDVDDLADRTPEDQCGGLLSHWQFGAQRSPG